MTYAYLHKGCGHLASDHRLIGETVAGPYTCRVAGCACQIMQSDPLVSLTRGQFERLNVDRAPDGRLSDLRN